MDRYNFEYQSDLEEIDDEPLGIEESVVNEEIKEEVKKALDCVKSADSAREKTKKILKNIFLRNLKVLGASICDINEFIVEVKLEKRFMCSFLTEKVEEIIYMRKYLPKIFLAIFGFNAISAGNLLDNFNKIEAEFDSIIVFNGIDMGNREDLKTKCKRNKYLHTLLWLNPNNYPELLSMHQAAETVETLEWTNNQLLQDLNIKENMIEKKDRMIEKKDRIIEEKDRIIEEMKKKLKELEGQIGNISINKD